MSDGKEGRSTDQTPPYKERAPLFAPSRFVKRSGAPAFVRKGGAELGLGHPSPHCPPGLPFEKHERPDWRDHYNRRADQHHGKGPALLDEHTRLAIARTQLASTEMQLRVESRRFEVAHVQLQVEAEKTGTAKAQLAVEKACRQIRQLDIELELKHASAAAAKPERDAARDVARLVDLDTQATVSQLKKEAAQLQLNAQAEGV